MRSSRWRRAWRRVSSLGRLGCLGSLVPPRLLGVTAWALRAHGLRGKVNSNTTPSAVFTALTVPLILAM
jgi:hypothetical protein